MIQYALLALSAVNAIQSIKQGYAENKEYQFNADLLGAKAGDIQVKKNIEYAQYERLKGNTYSTAMSNIAGMGIKPTGSALAVALTAQRNIMIDQVIGQFNIEREKQYTQAESAAQRRAGSRAIKSGYSQGLKSVLSGAMAYKAYGK